MINKYDWNYERYRTRDLLLEYDEAIMMPEAPIQKNINMIYPWENIMLNALIKQLYTIANNSGYTGTKEDFKTQFGSYLQSKQTIFDTIDNFPEIGDINKLYFDTEEKILYYWDNGYYPINALLIENSILNAGTSID